MTPRRRGPDTGGARRAAPPGPALRTLAAALLAGSLGACSQRGDLGRPRPSILAEEVAPALGTSAAAWRGEPASDLPFTDDEAELRRRAWRFLMPSEGEGPAADLVADAVRVRLLSPAALAPDPAAYGAGLMSGPFRSPASRYRRLGEDAAADAALVAPFAALSLRVEEADRVRLALLERGRAPGLAAAAPARVAENRCLAAWVRAAAHARALAYRAALDRLVVEAPQGEGIGAERALAELDARRRALDALPVAGPVEMGCLGPERGGPLALPGRPERAAPGAIVAKG